MKRPAGPTKLAWMDKRKEWLEADDARKIEIETWLTEWTPHGPRVVVSPAAAGPVCVRRSSQGYYRHLSDHLMDHLKPAVPAVDVGYWPRYGTVQETCKWMDDVSVNKVYAELAAAGMESDDMILESEDVVI